MTIDKVLHYVAYILIIAFIYLMVVSLVLWRKNMDADNTPINDISFLVSDTLDDETFIVDWGKVYLTYLNDDSILYIHPQNISKKLKYIYAIMDNDTIKMEIMGGTYVNTR